MDVRLGILSFEEQNEMIDENYSGDANQSGSGRQLEGAEQP
jgi:hypothetical protein